MNKRIIFIIIILTVLAGLGITLIILSREPQVSSVPELPVYEYVFVTGNAIDLSYVTVSNRYGEFTITGGDNPVLAGYEGFPVSVFYFLHILNVSSRLISWGLVTDEALNLSIFGLDPPQAKVLIQPENGEAVTLLVGNNAPDGNVYVKLDDKPQIYLASSFDIALFFSSILDLMDTTLTPPALKDEYEKLIFESITFGGIAREEITIVNVDPADKSIPFVNSGFRIINPVNALVSIDGSSLLDSLFGLYAFSAISVISEAGDLDRFGLLQPWSTAEVTGAGGNFRIHVSKPDVTEMVFVYREGTSLVYVAMAYDFPWLDASWYDLMDKMVILPFIDNIASIDIKTGQRTETFSLSGQGNNLTVKAGDIEIETGNFRNFYQTLIGARYDEYIDVSGESILPPFLEIIFNYRDTRQSADIVSFHESSGRRILTSLNGGRPLLTLSAYTDQLLSDLDLILSGQRVRPYL